MTSPLKKPQTSKLPHPMQPIGFDKAGIIRFKPNEIVRYMLDSICATGRKFDLNDLAREMAEDRFSREDYTQLMQLIGYSVSGAGDLSQFSRKVIKLADEEAERVWQADAKRGLAEGEHDLAQAPRKT